MKRLAAICVVAAAVSFGLGISLPLITFERLVFFRESPSLIGIVSGLWADGDQAIAAIVALFSIVFPLVKIGLAATSLIGERDLPAWAGAISKWSMMDVLLVAIFIFAAKTSGLATAFTQPGIWFYAAATALLAIAGPVRGRASRGS